MKKAFLFLLVMVTSQSFSQMTGDTIVVKTFKYGSATRDTAIQFPTSSTTYEKIIMRYNMRCKNGLVSTSSNRNLGCGEWDYSCNTYIADSTRMEQEQLTHPSHIISNFTGTVFPYTTLQPYDYFNYSQTQVTLNSITTETQYTVGAGSSSVPNFLKANEKSGRSQILLTAAELTSAGFTAGNIDGMILDVSNAGGTANFCNLGIQTTTQTALTSASVTLTGFTTVYNANYTFVNGNNRIQFFTPFNWNGTDNLLIDCSFTNSNPGSPIVFNGVTTTSVNALYANNNYAVNLESDGHVNINSTFLNTITGSITVSFWAYGNKNMMPTNTSILWGWSTNPNERQLNIHLPWSNNNVYWECGFNNGYDSQNKVATAANQGGQWNHWAFTKNTGSGWMRIYLNGTLWLIASAKTKPITIMNLILGKDASLNNNYKGKVNELTIWDKEFVLADIKAMMNVPITPSHPYYSNLVAYYKMDEGTGSVINDTKNSVTSNGTNIFWGFDRGNKLSRMFNEANVKPNITLLRGTYSVTTNTVTVKDSVGRGPNTIQQYSITSNATVTPMAHDAVVLASTTNTLYNASPLNIYDGDTGLLTGTIAATPNGTITITNLNYIKRHPYYIELMSFVTPYGIGLDLGMTGKTWYFDVSDYAPLLKGKKRFLMALGGEWQEQMDIDFLFIVGTPPRTVLECNQIWQGGARWGGSSIGSINNDTRFTVSNVPTLASAKAFKMRSTITGHGAEGEFHYNGGLVNHYFNINGGANEFNWQITRGCAANPVYPQGGTWIYDRQGWCPGEYSLLKEYDVTPYITPGSTVTLDYNTSAPSVASGDYRYIAAHQLISYGGPNFGLDAAILDVNRPSNKVLYSRENPMCAKPLITVQNTGSVAITSLDIDYWMNSNSAKETYKWTGNLAFMDTVTVHLPIGNLWTNGILPSNNRFNVELKKANNLTDHYLYNNKYSSQFTLPDVLSDSITVEFKTNNMADPTPNTNSYKIVDDMGNTIAGASALTTPNTVYSDSYILNGCYKLIVEDTGEDGLQWWANGAQGAGYVQLKNAQGTVVKTFNPDFGKRFEYSFTTKQYMYAGVKENELDNTVHLYPNPARDKFEIAMENTENVKVNITDMLGRNFELPNTITKDKMIFDSSSLKAGVYLVKITKDNAASTKKLVVD